LAGNEKFLPFKDDFVTQISLNSMHIGLGFFPGVPSAGKNCVNSKGIAGILTASERI
jgi:hypothetical protein